MTLYRRLAMPAILAGAAFAAPAALGQPVLAPGGVAETQRALAEAREQSAIARKRAEELEAEARRATEEVEKTVREAAALAARIQETEADIAFLEARMRIVKQEHDQLKARLAEREQPLIRLTAGLQRLSRRPALFALLRPGSVQDAMHVRALFETMMPVVKQRTAALRSEITKGNELEARARKAAGQMRIRQNQLLLRRRSLVAVEARQRLAQRTASGTASREADRAIALAEKARDLGELVKEVGKQGELRKQLAQLPGPIMRPVRPEDSKVADVRSTASSSAGPARYILPLAGRLVSGFGDETKQRGPLSRGIVLAARPGAQAVAPAAGRVAFAGPYGGYGQIVIIEHDGEWTTLVTGLLQLDAAVGEKLVAGSPLGVTGDGQPLVSVELRHNGEPVNPLQYLRSK